MTFALASSATPGPNNLMAMTSGANFGFVRTIPQVLGVSLGFVAMLLVVGAGLAGIFIRFPVARIILEVVSVGYLLFLAWRIASAKAVIKERGETTGRPLTFLQAALFQWVNPKAWTMAITAATVYAPGLHAPLALFIVAGVFGVINLPSIGAWTVLGAQMHRFLTNPVRLRIFNITAAVALLASLAPVVLELRPLIAHWL
jgi:threonine/homoserine/homoserine lactone efflux protein